MMAACLVGAEENTSSLHYHVVLLGKTGTGKSATGNTILGRKAFKSKLSFRTVTQEVKSESITIDGVNLTIYDTPGFFDPDNEQSPEEMISNYEGLPDSHTSDPLVFLLVLRPDRFTAEEKHTIEVIEDYLPDWLLKNTWIIFTRGDELEREGDTIEDLIEESKDLKKVVQNFGNRYFVFNNVTQHPEQQVQKLIEAIREVKPRESASESETFLQRRAPAEHETHSNERRLLLLGKTGSGKSATGNSILRKKQFQSEPNFSSVTKQCDIQRSDLSGRDVSVVDTPGFSALSSTPKDLAQEMANSVALCTPGPHAFLYVVSLTARFKREDENAIKNIEKIYGEEVAKYTIPVFTHSDQLEGKRVEDLIKENETLSSFVQQCGGRYHIMNNKDMRNRGQVKDLLQKIDSMVEQNGGGCYSNEMFQFAQSSVHEVEEESDPVQETKESWRERMWKRAQELFQRFKRHFDAAVDWIDSLPSKIVKLVNNVSCMTRDKSDKMSAYQMSNIRTEEAQQFVRSCQRDNFQS